MNCERNRSLNKIHKKKKGSEDIHDTNLLALCTRSSFRARPLLVLPNVIFSVRSSCFRLK